ncbi:MAG: [NiFe]-hydrogenase assembly chaperone HybE [Rhodocyclaceae bacterium]|nr:[NiFe]-hydrogenase assembly chaperone HybE [Rhodocyclaceae bacterium]
MIDGGATPAARGELVREVFESIHREQMEGLPLLNKALSVATLGFQDFRGRTLGMLITPWMMGLMLLPNAEDGWERLPPGHKATHEFPGGALRFMLNAIDGLGPYQMHSVHSPVHVFADQAAAMEAAAAFLGRILADRDPNAVPEDPVDEELLGKILRGEPVPEIDGPPGTATAATPRAATGGR